MGRESVGDEEASRHSGRVRCILRPALSGHDPFAHTHHGRRRVAAGAVQGTFIRAYARWPRIRRYDRPEAWVRRVAINRSRDHFRAASRRTKYETEASVPDMVDSLDDRADTAAMIREALRRPSP
ncbi:MAG: sigma factor [Acidimicrobiales bacterium]